MSLKLFSLALLATVRANPLEKVARDECQPCMPQGSTGTKAPEVGSDLKSLYVDLLASVKDIHFRKRWDDGAVDARAEGFCCRETLDCVNVQGLNIPMCYDKFTTQYAFPDSSHGSLTTGEYNSGGAKANLLTGDYTKEGGEQGNIYADDQQAKPNTATLSIPPQWTAAGVGSAIPVTELGSVFVYTTTIPGTTYTAPTTIAPLTIIQTSGDRTISVKTVPAQTITAPTTVEPVTSLVTETMPASSSTGAAAQVAIESTKSFGVSLFSALMYALYAL